MKTTWLPLCDPDISEIELAAVREALVSPRLSAGPVVEEFEAEFAQYLGRKHAIAVASGEIGLLLTLQACGIGQGDEVVASSHSFRETAHAIALTGARPVFADIDYWAGTIAPDKAAACLTERTRAIIAANANGHPAPWDNLRELAKGAGVALIEDFNRGDRVGLQGIARRLIRRLRHLRLLAARRARLRRGRHDRDRRR